jgi:hypothetical protein
LGSQADEIEVGGDTVPELGGRKAGETAMQSQKFGSSEPVVKTKIFRKEANFAADFYVREREAEDLCLAASGLYQAEQHFNGSTFPCAVRTEETEDLSATDLEGKAADSHLGAKLFAKADGFNGQVVGQKRLREKLLRKSLNGFLRV